MELVRSARLLGMSGLFAVDLEMDWEDLAI